MKCLREGNELIITFDDRMDSARCVQATKEVDQAIAEAKKELGEALRVRFNVYLVAYGSSSFLRICLSSAKSVGSKSFSIEGANETLRRVFSIAGFDKIMTIL